MGIGKPSSCLGGASQGAMGFARVLFQSAPGYEAVPSRVNFGLFA